MRREKRLNGYYFDSFQHACRRGAAREINPFGVVGISGFHERPISEAKVRRVSEKGRIYRITHFAHCM